MLSPWASQQQSALFVPAAISDFKNGAYSIKSVPKTLAEMWVENLAWGNFNPARVVAGVGLKTTGSADDLAASPVSTAELVAAIDVTGFIAVVDYALTWAGTAQPQIIVMPTNLPGYTSGWECFQSPPEGINIWDFSGAAAATVAVGASGVKHRLAILFSFGELAFSLDGNAVVAWPHDPQDAAVTQILLQANLTASAGNPGTSLMESISFYNSKVPALLPILSGRI